MTMIRVSKINGREFFINDDLIEVMEEIPDTKITLSNGHSYLVKESCEEIMAMIKERHRTLHVLKYNEKHPGTEVGLDFIDEKKNSTR